MTCADSRRALRSCATTFPPGPQDRSAQRVTAQWSADCAVGIVEPDLLGGCVDGEAETFTRGRAPCHPLQTGALDLVPQAPRPVLSHGTVRPAGLEVRARPRWVVTPALDRPDAVAAVRPRL